MASVPDSPQNDIPPNDLAKAEAAQNDSSDKNLPPSRSSSAQRKPILSEAKHMEAKLSDSDSLLRASEPGRRGTSPPRIYWVIPTTMIGSFIAGLAFAVAHHFFYRSLDGKAVGSINSQQWVRR